jgi:neuropilin 2
LLGDILTVDAIAIKGRPDFDEKGGEFVKSFTMHYSTDKETWTPYKSHGKIKVSYLALIALM